MILNLLRGCFQGVEDMMKRSFRASISQGQQGEEGVPRLPCRIWDKGSQARTRRPLEVNG